jgi:gliding motility-associated-like protein
LGDYEYSLISKKLFDYIKNSNYVITDIRKPRDTIIFTGTQIAYLYKTTGFKSPIFARYYREDTVWTKRNGKIVIDYIRPARGWVKDTFKNYIEVQYKPKSDFLLKKLGACLPPKVELKFIDSSWLYPETLQVNWGDTTIKINGFSDTIAKFPVLTHTYKKAGSYRVIVSLTSKKGCKSEYSQVINFGNYIGLKILPTCTNKICFGDTVCDFDFSNVWNKTNNLGKLFWDFGDGTKDSGFNICHTFPGIQPYVIYLKAVSNAGCISTFQKTVQMSKTVAAIKHQPTIFCSEIRKYFDSSWIIGNADSGKIVKWNWNFGDGTNSVTVQNPAHIYPAGGIYTVRLIVTNIRGCSDTTFRKFTVLGPMIWAKILGDSMGCAPFHARFDNLSLKTGNFIWEYGDLNNTFFSTKSDSNVSFIYPKAGIYYVHLTGGDSFYNPITGSHYYCSVKYPAAGQNQLRIIVKPGYHAAFLSPDTVCIGDSALIVNQSDTTLVHSFQWKMGNGKNFTLKFADFKFAYKKPGKYKITLNADVPAGTPCADTALRNISVLDFHPAFDQNCEASSPPSFVFSNTSKLDIANYLWTLSPVADTLNKKLFYSKNLVYDFGSDTGIYRICLSLNSINYCKSRECKTFSINQKAYLANVFTPGSLDGFNDTYKVPFAGIKEFELRIFNRWGQRVFYTQNPSDSWNGNAENKGEELPSGTYFYQVNFKLDCDKKMRTLNGSINLIR